MKHKTASEETMGKLIRAMVNSISGMADDLFKSAKRWHHAEWFRALYGWDARLTRLIASSSKGKIISGNNGYILNRRATDAEFDAFTHRLHSEAMCMLVREKEAKQERYGKEQPALDEAINNLKG